MKKKFSKIWGVGLTVMLLASLMVIGAPVSAAAADINEWTEFSYPDDGADGDWFRDAGIEVVGPMAKAIDGTLYAYAEVDDDHLLFKSDDVDNVGRTWAETDYADDLTGEEAIVAIVCSSLDADIVYVTDGNYVYKTDDAGDEFDYVARADLEKYLAGECLEDIVGEPITCLDVGYDANDDPFVFIGVKCTADVEGPIPNCWGEPDILYIAEESIGAQWIGLNLNCYNGGDYIPYSIGVTPDFATNTSKLIAVVSDGFETHVISSTLGVCGWSELAELVWNCIAAHHFSISAASRIGFPDDYEDSETVFVGVVADPLGAPGGDVYSVTKPNSIDRNVRPGAGGCIGDHTNIISLDICGDTDEASLIAGASDDTSVYYSTDGGWEWDASAKDPTGDNTTYVLWLGDECGESALAATSNSTRGGCECAISLSCVSDEVDDVGESWNQISLIATDISCVLDLDHSPGYLTTDSKTMFMVTECWDCCGRDGTTSLFRYDGTNWERVFCSTTYEDAMVAQNKQIQMVMVSPDFGDTATVFVANTGFDIFRSQDAGCEWKRLSYPCEERHILSWAVLDEKTVYAGGAWDWDDDIDAEGIVFKTDRYGSRPFDECEITGAGDIRYFGFTSDTILVGDDESQVFICAVDADEDWEDQDFDVVGDCQDVLPLFYRTSVVFDPGYTVSGDEGENTIFAAAGNVIARCIIDWDEDMDDQEWTEIYTNFDAEFWGIKVVGDTALYVGDTIANNIWLDDGGVVRSLNPLEEDEDDVVFEILLEELPLDTTLRGLRTLTAGEDGCPTSNVLWTIEGDPDCSRVWFYEDTLAIPVVLGTPADGAKLDVTKIDEVTLEWEELCGADCYEFELYKYCAECPDEKINVVIPNTLWDCDEKDCTEETCIVIDDLDPGTTYYWRVRVCIGEPTLSKWSDLRTFTTALPVVPYLCSPECGADGVILNPNFSWTAVKDADSYEVQIATDEAFTDAVTGTPMVNAWMGAPELDYGTVYYWKVRAVKDGVYSDWAVCIFTTAEEPPPEVWISPFTGEKFYSAAEYAVHVAEWEAKQAATPAYIWVIVAIGALLMIAVIILIVRTRRVA